MLIVLQKFKTLNGAVELSAGDYERGGRLRSSVMMLKK